MPIKPFPAPERHIACAYQCYTPLYSISRKREQHYIHSIRSFVKMSAPNFPKIVPKKHITLTIMSPAFGISGFWHRQTFTSPTFDKCLKEPAMATIPEALAIAVQHHQDGRLQTAEQIYRQILALEPNQVDAIHLLGVIAHQSGKHEVAVEYLGRAIGLKADAAPFHNNLGEAYRALHRTPEAVACYRRALELNPAFAKAHNNLGIALSEQGNLQAAVACYRRAWNSIPSMPRRTTIWLLPCRNRGNWTKRSPLPPRTGIEAGLCRSHNNLGFALQELGRLDEAVACYRRALE